MPCKIIFQTLILLLNMLAMNACTSFDSDSDPNIVKDPYHETTVLWHQGTIESAFQKARADNKNVFLYWGARWCPPCNELKSQVFTKPQFGDLMKGVVPVYLDGDTDYAQAWGELLQVTGYPTMLLLNADKRELLRIAESVTIEEFANIFTAAIQSNTDFRTVLQRATTGTPSDQDWRLLAYFSWYDAKDMDLHSEEVLAMRLQIAQRVPAHLVEEKSLLSARLLEAASVAVASPTPLRLNIKEQAGNFIATMLSDERSVYAARTSVIYSSRSILNWAYGDQPSKRALMWEKWLVGLQRLSKDPRLTADLRLWLIYPEIENYKQLNPNSKQLPRPLEDRLRAAVKLAGDSAQTAMERQSVIPGAGSLLGQGFLYDDAYTLLEDEADEARAPYYFYSALSRIAEGAGDQERALRYSGRAASTAEGRATRLQWLESDLKLLSKIPGQQQLPRVNKTVEQFYEVLFSMKDGFSGRSYRSIKQVGTTLKTMKNNPKLKELIRNYSYRCNKLDDKDKIRCEDHFRTALAKG